MDEKIVAVIIQEGTKILHAGIQNWVNRPVVPDKSKPDSKSSSVVATETKSPVVATRDKIDLPNREDTTYELKRRLAKELYKAELDLANGLMIAGRSCDCLSNKHTLELEACAEELVSQDPDNNVYREIMDWIPVNQHKVTPEAILSGKYKLEYPHMALQFKEFRKRVLGSDARSSISPQAIPQITVLKIEKPSEAKELPSAAAVSEIEGELTLEEAKKIAAKMAMAEVEKKWTALS